MENQQIICQTVHLTLLLIPRRGHIIRNLKTTNSYFIPVESDAGYGLLVADKVPRGAPRGALDDLGGGAAAVHRVGRHEHAPVRRPPWKKEISLHSH